MTDLPTQTDADAADAELMARYGITCVPVARFHYKFYRYTHLADAVAQAKRDYVARDRPH
ncbi:hypothetical protein [Sphingomonas oryzagri]